MQARLNIIRLFMQQINLIYSLQTDKYYNFVPKHEKPLYKTDVCYRKAT